MTVTRRTFLAGAAGLAAAPLVAGCTTKPAAAARRTFPSGFVWGAATSAYQIEGAVTADGRGTSIWDTFAHTPRTIADGSNADVACDHYHRWESDLDLMKQLGLQSYRFSIAWPRVLPTGRGQVNQKGLDFYKRIVDGLHQRNIAPLATVFHWDLPQPLQDRGGWENRDCARWFADYAAVVFEALGADVPTWLTINEPKTIVQVGYTYGTMAPGKQDPVAAAVAMHHLALGHGLAVQAFRAAGTTGRIGAVLNLAPAYPATATDAAGHAATIADAVENRAYLDPIFKGSYPADFIESLDPDVATALHRVIKSGDLATIGSKTDVLGVNYYNPVFVDDTGRYVTMKPTSLATWEQIYPQGLTDLLVRLGKDYGDVPLVITENGIPEAGSATVADGDDLRIGYVRDHLIAAHRAIQQGVRLEGYHLWSLLDNFEWAQGYTQRWGMVHVDFATGTRVPKRSAAWYADVIAHNGVPASA
jgi:beta-glucosidase